MNAEENRKPTRNSATGKWVVWGVVVLVGYVMSMGPVAAALCLWDHDGHPRGGSPDFTHQMYYKVYAPLVVVEDHARWLEVALNWYQNWWEELVDGP